MSEELTPQEDAVTEEQCDEVEFEEISSEEVDRVVSVLDELIGSVESENIRTLLEDSSNSILYLVYDDSDLEDSDDEGEGGSEELDAKAA